MAFPLRKNTVYKSCASAFLALSLLLAGQSSLAQGRSPARGPVSTTPADPVDQRLAEYTRLVPKMGFLRIYGETGSGFVSQLPDLIGKNAVNLDYEHDPRQRSDLLSLQMYRIGKMIEWDLPSATLFKVGSDSAFDHPYLCVITLNTGPYRADPDYATRFMASSLEREVSAKEFRPLIDNHRFLRFTVDHEVFHCLNAYFNGAPIKKDQDAVADHYQQYINEARADVFATLVHDHADPGANEFLQRMGALRSLSLSEMDASHFTGDLINRSLRMTFDTDSFTLNQVVEFSNELVAEIAPGLPAYGGHLANLLTVVEQMGGDAHRMCQQLQVEVLPAYDKAQVAVLLKQIEEAQRVVDGHTQILQTAELN